MDRAHALSGLKIQMKMMVSISARTTRPNVPAQKSHSSSKPCSSQMMCMSAEARADEAERQADRLALEAELLAEERDDRREHRDRRRDAGEEEQAEPHGPEEDAHRQTDCWNTTGIVAKPRLNDPLCAIAMAPATPKKTTAAGIAIEPPSTTSAVSLVAAVAMPFSAMSSFVDR